MNFTCYSMKFHNCNHTNQGTYSCEITYEEPGRWFKNSCLDQQLTTLNVLGKPDKVIVSMNNGTELEDGAILGPYTEGTILVLRCKASGGRPIPEVRPLLSLCCLKIIFKDIITQIKMLEIFCLVFSFDRNVACAKTKKTKCI